MIKERTILEILSQNRHDWLNQIQLIKGYLELERPERALYVIEDIIVQTHQESLLSRLDLPEFSEWLLTHSWNQPLLQIEFEILMEDEGQPCPDKAITSFFTQLSSKLEYRLDPKLEQQLFIQICPSKHELCFNCEFQGRMVNESNWKKVWLELCQSTSEAKFNTKELSENGIVFSVRWPIGGHLTKKK
jgi:stage 0 sporulation protein B (sporulation initiation phosphotransferase)